MIDDSGPYPKFYSLKQYFRYVRPGAVRIESQSNDPDVMVTAFNHKTTKNVIVIAINRGTADRTVDFNISNLGSVSSLEVIRTSASEHSKSLGQIQIAGNAFTYTLQNESISTFTGTYTNTGTPLNVSISSLPSSGTAPLVVDFKANVAGGLSPFSFNWDFGDGYSSTAQNPTHTYSTNGSFPVTLSVSDSNGNHASDSIQIEVSPQTHEITTPDIASGPSNGTTGVPYVFTSGGASCSQGHNVEYRFDWGDGSSSDWAGSSSAVHAWTNSGTFEVRVRARCTIDNAVVSSWAGAKSISIAAYTPNSELSLSSVTGTEVSGTGGSTEPGLGTHTFTTGTQVSVSATPNQDYRFSKWTGDVDMEASFDDTISVLMDRDKIITAKFFTKCGDVNGDLSITPSDAQYAFDIFLGKIQNPTEQQSENADVNCDGTQNLPLVTPGDAHAIFKKYLGMEELPGDCSCNSRSPASPAATLGYSDQSKRSITIGNAEGTAGETIMIPITVDCPLGIDSFGFDLIYPGHLIRFTGISKTELSLDLVQLDGIEIGEGRIRIGGYGNRTLEEPSEGALVIVVFEVRDGTYGESLLLLSNPVDDLMGSKITPGQLLISTSMTNSESHKPKPKPETYQKK